MYWLAFACMVLGFAVFPTLLQGRYFSFSDYVYDFMLLPRSGEMIMNVAWTLRNELVFYLLFFISIAVPFIRFKFILLWQVTVIFATIASYKSNYPLIATILSTYNLGFGAGLIAAYFATTKPTPYPKAFIIFGIASFAILMAVDWHVGKVFALPHAVPALGEVVGPILFTIASTAIIFGFASLESVAPIPQFMTVSILGASSYVLYLSHGLVSSMLVRLLDLYIPRAWPLLILIFLIMSAVVAAVVLHVFVERPTLYFLRRRISSASQRAELAPAPRD